MDEFVHVDHVRCLVNKTAFIYLESSDFPTSSEEQQLILAFLVPCEGPESAP